MPEQKLRETLAELEGELDQLDSLDDDTRRLLTEAMDEIAETLREERVRDLETASLVQRFEETGRDLYQSHPTLSKLVGRMVDILGQMGI